MIIMKIMYDIINIININDNVLMIENDINIINDNEMILLLLLMILLMILLMCNDINIIMCVILMCV